MQTMEGSTILDLEWDLLLVLDACRMDYFKAVNEIPGRLGMLESESDSCTIEWLVKNFPESYKAEDVGFDIIYVSGSPFVNSRRDIHNYYAPDHFKKIIDVWDWGFDSELDTVHPRTVCNATIQMLRDQPEPLRYGYKKPTRFISHFMQPHTPYIGEHKFPAPSWRMWRIGNLKPATPQTNDANLSTSFSVNQKKGPKEMEANISAIKDRVKRHKKAHPHSHEKFPLEKFTEKHLTAWRMAYASNLKLVLTEIEKLLTHIDPEIKVVITADHGEILGEEGDQWHPCNTTNTILTNIPWFEVDVRDFKDGEEDLIKERLTRLGYIE